MPINKETIISVFNEKLTLMQWLKTINKALEDAVLTGVEITKKGNATLSFKFTFEDGTYLETNDLVLQQGESVVNAYIQNGHLYLTLSNDTNLDAGNVKPVSNFSIDASQHLIVNYGDGTSQDLGAIFNGDITISGDLNVTGDIEGTKILGNEVLEKMTGYSFLAPPSVTGWLKTPVYVSCAKTGNKLTFVMAYNLTKTDNDAYAYLNLGSFLIPSAIGAKLYPFVDNMIDNKTIIAYASDDRKDAVVYIDKDSNTQISFKTGDLSSLVLGKTYYIRNEATFLLSDNMAQ